VPFAPGNHGHLSLQKELHVPKNHESLGTSSSLPWSAPWKHHTRYDPVAVGSIPGAKSAACQRRGQVALF
jgi:hypothetical protein